MKKIKSIILISSLLMQISLFGSQHQINSEEEQTNHIKTFQPVYVSNQTSSTNYIETDSSYLSFGVGLPSLLSINIGKRHQYNYQGIDVGIGGFPFFKKGFLTHVYLNYLVYPRPFLKSQLYLGAGIKYVFLKNFQPPSYLDFIPIYFILGKEWISKTSLMKFFQVDVGGVYIRKNGLKMFLNFQLAYGVGF